MNPNTWLVLDQSSGLDGLYCVHHRGKWISLITERKHDGQRHPGIDKSGEGGRTGLTTPNRRHARHHSIRDAPRGASAVTMLPGFPAGHGVSTKATGGEVGVVGFNNSI